ncbi:MAG TPA: hypothetical protein PL105_10845, partial [Caldilineaceae bacterium]|nr:hypothetical protein [Caldilineaceae bacterium]
MQKIFRFHPLSALFVLIALALFTGSVVLADPGPTGAETPTAVQSYSNASFTVNYNPASCQGTVTDWPTAGVAAMNHVADILDDAITNDGTILIDACYEVQDAATLAAAGPSGSVEACASGGGALPVANTAYPMALANALCGADQNGADAEISASANSTIPWDFCTTNCAWADAQKYDFVSTMIHELLHGLGWVDNILTDGSFDGVPNIFSRFIACNGATDGVCTDGQRLTDVATGQTLAAALTVGSGKLSFVGPNAKTAFAGTFANAAAAQGPFLFAPNPYQQGSSISHWDDNHTANTGRMMNAATGPGLSSRVVDAITLMSLKDLGWSVLESSDFSDAALNSYGAARHYNAAGIVGHSFLGTSVSLEAGPARSGQADSGNDGLTPTAWADGAQGGSVSATVANNRGCLSSWVDWQGDGSFDETADRVVSMRPV